MTPPHGGSGGYDADKFRRPEVTAAVAALRGLWHDLISQALAYHPLPPMRVDKGLSGRLSGRLREYAVWTPPALITAVGLIAMLIASDNWGQGAVTNLLA